MVDLFLRIDSCTGTFLGYYIRKLFGHFYILTKKDTIYCKKYCWYNLKN